MKRIIYVVLMNPFHAPVWLFTTTCMGRSEDGHTIEECYDYVARITRRIIKRGRVTVAAAGIEYIPNQDGSMPFPNHRGLFDILVLFSTCPRPLSAVIKKEASGWILVKQVIGTVESPAMDRSDIKDQVRIIGGVTKRVRERSNFVIFAGGHRSRKGNEILDSESGTFKSALKAGYSIAPVALINPFRLLDINSLGRGHVEVHHMGPILSEQYIGMEISEIAHLIHDRIQEEINKNIDKNTLIT